MQIKKTTMIPRIPETYRPKSIPLENKNVLKNTSVSGIKLDIKG
jgi:hypothetical protein